MPGDPRTKDRLGSFSAPLAWWAADRHSVHRHESCRPHGRRTLASLARALLPALIVVYTSGSMNAVPHGVAGSAFVPKPYSPDRVGLMLSRMARIHA